MVFGMRQAGFGGGGDGYAYPMTGAEGEQRGSSHLRPVRTPQVTTGPSAGLLLSAEEKRTMGRDDMAMYRQSYTSRYVFLS